MVLSRTILGFLVIVMIPHSFHDIVVVNVSRNILSSLDLCSLLG